MKFKKLFGFIAALMMLIPTGDALADQASPASIVKMTNYLFTDFPEITGNCSGGWVTLSVPAITAANVDSVIVIILDHYQMPPDPVSGNTYWHLSAANPSPGFTYGVGYVYIDYGPFQTPGCIPPSIRIVVLDSVRL